MKPAAKQNDLIMAVDVHLVVIVGVPTPVPNLFNGQLATGLSTDVLIDNLPAAVAGSGATNLVPHIPVGGPFAKPPTNQGTIQMGSTTVLVNGKAAARAGDPAITCNDPVDLPMGTVVGTSTVLIGG
jgi:uncharacterized Zn-binding protein involved in type VI secretion